MLTLQLGREVLDIAARTVGVGVTTDEVDRVVHEVRSHGEGRQGPGGVACITALLIRRV